MTVTLTPTCPLCGLRYASRPMLELHIREDHRQRRRAEPGGPSRGHGVASRPSGTTKEVTAMTATRRLIRAVRHVNDELVRASEAIIRSARVPQPRPQASSARGRGCSPGHRHRTRWPGRLIRARPIPAGNDGVRRAARWAPSRAGR